MSDFKLTGKIKVINETQVISEKFAKREFVVTAGDENYPQDIILQATQDKCAMLDGYNEGDGVECSINVRGRLWVSPKNEQKYFNTLECWRIEKVGDIAKQYAPPTETAKAEDDLPF